MPEQPPLDILVSLIQHTAGVPDPNVDYGGVPIPDWVYTAKKNADALGKFTPTKPLKEYSFAELSVALRSFADQALKDLPVRTTAQLGPSTNKLGGPPWKISTTGGNILLEVDSANGWESLHKYSFGIKVAYYMEIEFA